METLNSTLINAGLAALWAWEGTKALFGALWTMLDTVLNPVLSPVLSFLNPPCTALGDALYAILSPLPVWAGLSIISAVAGVVMLVAFGYTSNQAAIGRAKDDIKGNLPALKLYKDELHVTWTAQARLLGAILRLQWYMLGPVLVMTLPMLLGLTQMGIRYQWRPLHSGEQTLIRLTLAADPDASVSPWLSNDLPKVNLEPSSGMVVEAGPVGAGRELAWRIRATTPGRHTLKFRTEAAVVEKELVVGDAFERVSAERTTPNWAAQLLHPAEPALNAESGVQSIEILYPGRDSWVYGANYWVIYFFVVSMVFALIFKPVFRVKF